jgi:ssDNA-specific exonuclease RecJ
MAADYAPIKDGLLAIIDELSGRDLDGSQRLQELHQKLNQQQFNLVVMG